MSFNRKELLTATVEITMQHIRHHHSTSLANQTYNFISFFKLMITKGIASSQFTNGNGDEIKKLS